MLSRVSVGAVDLQTSPPVSVSGIVLDDSGKPVAGAEVVFRLAEMGSGSFVLPTTTSDNQGRFTFSNISITRPPNALFVLEARKETDYLELSGDMVCGSPTQDKISRFRIDRDGHAARQTVRFGPRRGKLRLSAVNSKGEPFEAKFKLALAGHTPPDHYCHIPFESLLPPGRYELSVFKMNGEYLKSVSVEIRPRQVTETVIKIQ
jgi:hypothetical protein